MLRDIDLDVAKGERIVICGPSGVGKSTIVSATTATEQENMPAATNGSPTNSAGGAMKQKQRMSVAEKEAHEKGVREELKGLKVAELKRSLAGHV